MSSNKPVGQLCQWAEARDFLIDLQQPLPARILGQRSKDRFRSAVNVSIGLDELHAFFESFPWQFGELLGYALILERDIIDARSRGALPSPDPKGAETALAIENHQRLGGRRLHLGGRHSTNSLPQTCGQINFHAASLRFHNAIGQSARRHERQRIDFGSNALPSAAEKREMFSV